MALVYDRGLVMYLYAKELLRFGATTTAADDEAVSAEHHFVCLSADAREGLWTPLHSTRGQDRLPIMEAFKSGQARWTQGVSYYSTSELWRIPHKAIQRAAQVAGDRSTSKASNRIVAAAVPALALFSADTAVAGSV